MALSNDVRSRLANGVAVGHYDAETQDGLEALALSLAVLWEVDVDGVAPAVVFFAGDGWEWAVEATNGDD